MSVRKGTSQHAALVAEHMAAHANLSTVAAREAQRKTAHRASGVGQITKPGDEYDPAKTVAIKLLIPPEQSEPDFNTQTGMPNNIAAINAVFDQVNNKQRPVNDGVFITTCQKNPELCKDKFKETTLGTMTLKSNDVKKYNIGARITNPSTAQRGVIINISSDKDLSDGSTVGEITVILDTSTAMPQSSPVPALAPQLSAQELKTMYQREGKSAINDTFKENAKRLCSSRNTKKAICGIAPRMKLTGAIKYKEGDVLDVRDHYGLVTHVEDTPDQRIYTYLKLPYTQLGGRPTRKKGTRKSPARKSGKHKPGTRKSGKHKPGKHKPGKHKPGKHKQGKHKPGKHKLN